MWKRAVDVEDISWYFSWSIIALKPSIVLEAVFFWGCFLSRWSFWKMFSHSSLYVWGRSAAKNNNTYLFNCFFGENSTNSKSYIYLKWHPTTTTTTTPGPWDFLVTRITSKSFWGTRSQATRCGIRGSFREKPREDGIFWIEFVFSRVWFVHVFFCLLYLLFFFSCFFPKALRKGPSRERVNSS